MQSLASYGSDSDESSTSPRRDHPAASTSEIRSRPHPPVPPVLNRLRSNAGQSSSTSGATAASSTPASASSSKTNSPLLSGVVPTSRSGTPTPRRTAAQSAAAAAAKASSASPPPHSRAAAPRSTIETRNDLSSSNVLRPDRPRNGDDSGGEVVMSGMTNLADDESTRPSRSDGRIATDARERPGGREVDARQGQSDRATLTIKTASAVNLDSLREFGIPRIATGPCNPAVQAKLTNFDSLRRSRGLHFNDSLSNSKAFRNPRIYQNLVEFLDVDETGTGFDPEVWDSTQVGRDGTSARLAELQKLRSEAKQAQVGQPNSRSTINFTSSSSSSSTTTATKGGGGDMASRYREREERDRHVGGGGGGGPAAKRSRWDYGGGGGVGGGKGGNGSGERSKSPMSASSRRR